MAMLAVDDKIMPMPMPTVSRAARCRTARQYNANRKEQQPWVIELGGKLLEKLICLGAALIFSVAPCGAANLQPDSLRDHQHTNSVALEARGNKLGDLEDALAVSLRKLEAGVDSALGFLADFGIPKSSQGEDGGAVEGEEVVKEVWEVIARKYVDVRGAGFNQEKWAQLRDAALRRPLHDKPSVERAIKGMLAEGISDRFTRYIPAEQFAKMQSYDITGVGLNLCNASELEEKTEIHADEPGLYVLGLIAHSPANKAGIVQGDQILEVDGVPLREQSPFQAASLIQGPETGPVNPNVLIKVKRIDDGSIQKVALQRSIRDNSSPVTARILSVAGRKVGQIRLDKFVARTQPDVAAAVVKLEQQGAEEFVLDLRDNLGGLVEEGVEVARLFLGGDATIVNRLDSGGMRRKTAAGSRPLTEAPLTLLVNERTASASEILAGALRDNCRAVLVGQRTYGKGLIQSVYQLEDGSALAVTIGKYLTPARTDIDREGIRPDFGSFPDRSLAASTLATCRAPAAA